MAHATRIPWADESPSDVSGLGSDPGPGCHLCSRGCCIEGSPPLPACRGALGLGPPSVDRRLQRM